MPCRDGVRVRQMRAPRAAERAIARTTLQAVAERMTTDASPLS
jgi:hypothetical protein